MQLSEIRHHSSDIRNVAIMTKIILPTEIIKVNFPLGAVAGCLLHNNNLFLN